MKRYTKTAKCCAMDGDDAVYYVGSTAEIKALYKSIMRNESTNIAPVFTSFPDFSAWKQVYALEIRDDNAMFVINSDTFMSLVLDDLVELI